MSQVVIGPTLWWLGTHVWRGNLQHPHPYIQVLFSDPRPPLLPSCQTSLHFPLVVRLHSRVLCASTNTFNKTLSPFLFPLLPAIPSMLYSLLQHRLLQQVSHFTPVFALSSTCASQCYKVLGIKGIVLMFTHLAPSLQEPYILLRQFLP